MKAPSKDSQLQIRISAKDKRRLQSLARSEQRDLSEWILSKILPRLGETFQNAVKDLRSSNSPQLVLAEIHDLLSEWTRLEFAEALAHVDVSGLSPQHANYVAAMVEFTAAKHGLAPPPWISSIKPLVDPVFGSELLSLRTHLLISSPPPFRARNIFIDSTVGARV